MEDGGSGVRVGGIDIAHRGTVKLTLYSEKEQEKGETRVVEPRVIEQICQDFEPYRAAKDKSGV